MSRLTPVAAGTLFILTLCALAACQPTWIVQQERPAVEGAQGSIFVLRERPPAIIEIDRPSRRERHVFPLASQLFERLEPEGLSYVSNQAVDAYGLFDLPPSVHGGYFLVADQTEGRLHIFDVPVGTERAAAEVVAVIVPELDEDASAVYYGAGEIWIVSGARFTLTRIASVADGDAVRVLGQYNLRALNETIGDIEGLAFKEPGIAFLADDATQQVYRYDRFPECLSDRSCERVWERTFGSGEPSGAAWDGVTQHLLIVDDEGEIFALNEDGQGYHTILATGYDLEGVTVPTTE